MSQDSAPTTANTASNLIVNYIPKEFNDEMLNKLFAPFGEIESARIIRDKVTSETKGFGFVKFCNGESASKAICALQGFEILGKRLKISYSHHNKAPIPLNMMEVLSQQQQQQYNRMMTSPHTSSRPNSPQQQTISPVQQPIQPQIIFVVQQPPSPQINYPLSISPVALSEADISVQDSTLPPLSPAHAATSPTLSPTQQVSFAALTQQMLQMNHLQQQQQLLMQQQQQQAQLAALDSMMFPFGSFFPLQQMNMMA